MGNEASRGLSPGVPPSPRSPVRRTKSFSNDTTTSNSSVPSPLDRSIQRMDKTIRKRVRGGVTYNMKIVLRGERGTGKTSLFQRLRGAPIPTTHEPTPQLQSATINWSFRVHSEETVKCDVWDVVDKGVVPDNANPFETSGTPNGTHLVATVDATTVDVYHETHGVVFLLDVTKPHTLEYVRQQLDHVPVHIPTLVLGNFRDCGAQRKIFKEDIQDLLYGGQHQAVRRPHELLYFECSLLNCYGLKSLHQYFGIPFLQLKQQTIRQQLRILEGEFSHLKHDLQAKIAEQKYADYLVHIKATGSDIRTGRRAAAGSTASEAEGATEASGSSDHAADDESPTSKTRLDRTLSSSSDIVVHSDTSVVPPVESPVAPAAVTQLELEDLPERTVQEGNGLKIEYTEEERAAARQPEAMPPHSGMSPVVNVNETKQDTDKKEPETATNDKENKAKAVATKPVATKELTILDSDRPMNLEDFQVPKPKANDLDSFYSDDESEEDAGDDDDVVISTATARMAKAASAKFHKQQFLDSDESDSDTDTPKNRRKKPSAPPAKQRSPRRHLTKVSVEDHAASSVSTSSAGVVPSPPSPVRPSAPVASPRLSASPPRPTTSPQHSPQHSPHRRVREAPTVASETLHATEESSEAKHDAPEPVVELVAPSTATDERELPAAEDIKTADVDQGLSEDEMKPVEKVIQAAVETEEVARASDETPAKETEDTSVSVPMTQETQDAEIQLEDPVAVAPVVTTAPVDAPTTVAPVVSEDHADDVEMIVAVSADEIEGFFSDDDVDDAMEEKSTGRVEEAVTAVETDPVRVEDASPLQVVKPPLEEKAGSQGNGHADRSSGILSQLKQQRDRVELTLTDDDEPNEAPETTPPKATKPTKKTKSGARKIEMLMSASDDSDTPAPAKPVDLPRPAPAVDLTSISSPPLAPMAASESGKLGDILEAFLNDSGSESDGAKPTPVVSKALVESDDDDDEEIDRFAAYDKRRSTQRRTKTARRKQLGDLGNEETTTASLSSSQTSSISTSDATNRATGIANQDVLAAIRMAEQDALRMLEATAAPVVPPVSTSNRSDETTTTKVKKSSSRKHGNGDDDDGKKKKTKKKNDKESGRSSRSKRHEVMLTDEDD